MNKNINNHEFMYIISIVVSFIFIIITYLTLSQLKISTEAGLFIMSISFFISGLYVLGSINYSTKKRILPEIIDLNLQTIIIKTVRVIFVGVVLFIISHQIIANLPLSEDFSMIGFVNYSIWSVSIVVFIVYLLFEFTTE